MIDIKLIRTDPEKFEQAGRVKSFPVDIRALLEVDSKISEFRRELQEIRTTQNVAGKEISRLKGDEKQAAIEKIAEVKKELNNGLPMQDL